MSGDVESGGRYWERLEIMGEVEDVERCYEMLIWEMLLLGYVI